MYATYRKGNYLTYMISNDVICRIIAMPRALVLAVLVGTIALALALPVPVKKSSPPLKKTSKPHDGI